MRPNRRRPLTLGGDAKSPPALLRRLSLGVIDQMLSSGSNFVALLLGARYLDPQQFGSYSLVLLSYTLTLGVVRALCSEAMLVRPGEGFSEQHHRARLATGAAVWIGIGAATAFAGLSLSTQGALSNGLVILALAIPGLLVQDTLRYAAFSRGDPKAAVISDGIWAFGQMMGFAILVTFGHPSAYLMLLAWSVPGVLGGCHQMFRERVLPAVRQRITWIIRNGDLSVRYALDFLSGAGAGQLAAYVLVIAADLAAVGSIRGAQTLFGPVNILLTGAYIVLVPEGRRAAQRSTRYLTLVSAGAAAAFAAVAAGMLVVFLALRPAQGQLLLGSTWPAARVVIVPVGLASVAGGLIAGATAGLRSLSASRELLRVRLITIPTTLALPLVGAIGWKASGLAYGIALSVWWNVIWYWHGYIRAVRTFDASVLDLPGAGSVGGLAAAAVPTE